MARDFNDLIVRQGPSLNTLMQRMDQGAMGILLLVDDEGRLVRTITDGDLRRAMLSSAEADAPEAVFAAGAPVTAPYDMPDPDLLALMDRHQIDHVPLLDEAGRPVGLRRRREIRPMTLLSPPHLSDGEARFVQEAFDTNWIAPVGPNIDAFEADMAARVGVGHALAVCSGTAALHLAAILAGVGPGDLVLCSSLTFVGSINPVLYQGAQPVLIDSEPESWNMCPRALETAFAHYAREGRQVRAVIVTSLYGQSADMNPIVDLCVQYGAELIEDSAEALGTTYHGRASGTFGRFGAYSFNGNKIITTSGGGMLISDDTEAMARARKLSTQAREPVAWYQHTEVGFNYRMSNILAGVGRGQLQVLDDRVAGRRAIFQRYADGLADLEGLTWMPEVPGTFATRWLTVATVEAKALGVDATSLIRLLNARNIEARHVWKPMHRQPLFADAAYFPHADGSFSDRAFATGICLPSGTNMSMQDVDRVVETIRSTVATARRLSGAA